VAVPTYPNILTRHILQLLGKQAQTVPAPRHGLKAQIVFIIQSGSQTYFTFDLGHRADGTSHFPHHQHVKAIRAKINCSI
jgi:hypothetical protein